MNDYSDEEKNFVQQVNGLWDIITNLREDKEKARFDSLCEAYADFESSLGDDLRESIFLSKYMLRYAVNCYFDSIYRYKIFAKTARADSHKQAAYQFKWIAKIKPIQIRQEMEKVVPGVNMVNAYFATHVALTFLESAEKVDLMGHCEQAIYDNLVYQAQYRHVSGRALAAELCALVKSCKSNVPRQQF